LHAEFILQLSDLRADCRLADMAARRGAAELAFSGQADGVFEIAEVHH